MGGKGTAGRRPLTPAAFEVLLALADEERHGYGIILEVEGRSGGRARLGPGTLYGALKRLREGGLIEESDERPAPDLDDERRRYYRLTDLGGRTLAAEVARLEAAVRSARAKGVRPSPSPGAALAALYGAA